MLLGNVLAEHTLGEWVREDCMQIARWLAQALQCCLSIRKQLESCNIVYNLAESGCWSSISPLLSYGNGLLNNSSSVLQNWLCT